MAELIESGDLYFFYRPKIHEEMVRGVEDVARFYAVMATPGLFRLLIVGQKYMPQIIPGESAPSERNWGYGYRSNSAWQRRYAGRFPGRRTAVSVRPRDSA